MQNQNFFTSYILAFTFVSAVTFIYVFIAIALVPYWQSLSGAEIQAWWSGPFTGFSTIMVPLHLLSIVSIAYAFIRNRKSNYRTLWWVALLGLLICQAYNFVVYGGTFNPVLQAGNLLDQEALNAFDSWDFHHTIRTIAIGISLVALIIIGIRSHANAQA